MTFWLYVFLVGYKEETTNLRTPANWYFRGANSSSHAYENYDRHRLLNLPNFSRPKWLYQLVCVLYVSLQKLQKMVAARRHLPIKTEEEEPLVKSFYGSPRGSEKKKIRVKCKPSWQFVGMDIQSTKKGTLIGKQMMWKKSFTLYHASLMTRVVARELY